MCIFSINLLFKSIGISFLNYLNHEIYSNLLYLFCVYLKPNNFLISLEHYLLLYISININCYHIIYLCHQCIIINVIDLHQAMFMILINYIFGLTINIIHSIKYVVICLGFTGSFNAYSEYYFHYHFIIVKTSVNMLKSFYYQLFSFIIF